ncbi:MAG TPA: four helix bundle protein [Gemmatimonadaceae bacterium]|nr:four helix bundle protein [Gemmatimonadaceae bacterium]
MPLSSYRELRVWQRAITLANDCCAVADALPAAERFALAAQMRRAAVSIPANIAEGYGRNGRAAYVHHLGIARGSLYELETLIEIARMRDYITEDTIASLQTRTREVAAMLTKLRMHLAPPSNP